MAILREVGAQVYQCTKSCSDMDDKSKNGPHSRLRDARITYMQAIEVMLPAIQAAATARRLQKVQELREKKEKAVQRRQLWKKFESYDQESRSLLEQERRDYVLQLSLQQRDALEASEREILSRHHSKATDNAILEAVQKDLASREQVLAAHIASEASREKVLVESARFVQELDVKSPSSLGQDVSSEPADAVPAAFSASTALSKKDQPPTGLSLSKSSISNTQTIVTDHSSSSPEKEPSPLPFQSHSSPAMPPQVPHELILRNSANASPTNTFPTSAVLTTSSMTIQQDDVNEQLEGNVPPASMALYWLTEQMTHHDCAKVLKAFFDFLEGLPGSGADSDMSIAYNGANIETLLLSTALELVDSVTKTGSFRSSPDVVASTVLVILTEIGFQLFPKEALNGVVTLEKLQKQLKKLGGGRLEVLNAVTDHLSVAVGKNKTDPEELSNIFTSRLVHFVDEDNDRIRVERKVQKLLHLAAVTPKVLSKSPTMTEIDNQVGDRFGGGGGAAAASASVAAYPPSASSVQIAPSNPKLAPKDKISGVKFLSANKSIADEFEDLDDVDVIGKPPPVRDLAEDDDEDEF